ncbi:MAG: exo-alpha-sialidase, partial [Clostridia bacterium]|nr:exo-alpha-sialidase [Clostridia bacterium]
ATEALTTKVDMSVFPVTPALTAAQSAARINNRLSSKATKIASDYYQVSGYESGYGYKHHPGLAVFKGRLYASFSRGYKYEDAPGQDGVVTSAPLDNLNNWSTPVVAAPARTMSDGHKSFVIPGFLYVAGDKLLLFYMDKSYGPQHFDSQGNFLTDKVLYQNAKYLDGYNRVVYTTDGVNWSEPENIGVAANESPRQTLTGQWLAGAGSQLIYSGDTKPTGFYWEMIGMTSTQYRASLNRGSLSLLTEASWYQTDDYIIHQMLRSHDGYVWMSESYDNGKTWTEAYPTNFTSDTTMANFGRLPDGRFYFVGSPTMGSDRYPISLYVSKDGYNFNTAYTLRDEQYTSKDYNWTKTGAFAYPEVLINGEYMYVIHSQYKEKMTLTRVKLSDIK